MSGAGGDAGLVAAGDAWDMSQVVTGPARAGAPAHPVPRRHGLLDDLDRPGDVFARLGPNWFASVMGTGIVATAAADLPVPWPGLRGQQHYGAAFHLAHQFPGRPLASG
jgi:hypothetical protein